jgi:hypothetical protein
MKAVFGIGKPVFSNQYSVISNRKSVTTDY